MSGRGRRHTVLEDQIADTGGPMQKWFAGLKALGWLVVALMVVAMLYATFTSLRYWSGIGV